MPTLHPQARPPAYRLSHRTAVPGAAPMLPAVGPRRLATNAGSLIHLRQLIRLLAILSDANRELLAACEILKLQPSLTHLLKCEAGRQPHADMPLRAIGLAKHNSIGIAVD